MEVRFDLFLFIFITKFKAAKLAISSILYVYQNYEFQLISILYLLLSNVFIYIDIFND